jgi:uridine kinase
VSATGAAYVGRETVGGVARAAVIEQVARLIPPGDGVRVGIDGVDGAGKTTFADELARATARLGRPPVRVSADDFHHPRAVRYRRGRDDPAGFYLDSYDYERLFADVLDPLGPGGDRWYASRAHDLAGDAGLNPPKRRAVPPSLLILDGLFLHRPELAGVWDLSVFLDVPFRESVRRMHLRDGSPDDETHPALRRYVEGQRIYVAEAGPQNRADVLIDNTDEPRILRPR